LLVSYGPDQSDHDRRAATKPGDIPIFMPMEFEPAIGFETAKALGFKYRASSRGLPTR
jgi:hypothetical protein